MPAAPSHLPRTFGALLRELFKNRQPIPHCLSQTAFYHYMLTEHPNNPYVKGRKGGAYYLIVLVAD